MEYLSKGALVVIELAYTLESTDEGLFTCTAQTRYNAEGEALTRTQKQLISQLSSTLAEKEVSINERGLTSTDWTVYNEGTKRTRCSTEPTSNITAETVMVDGFTLSQKDTAGITTRPLAIRKSGTWCCYGWDLTKNICEVFGSNGYINTIYTPYGAVTSGGSTVQPLQWNSEYSDTELGLVYYNYRYYNPIDEKWLRKDALIFTYSKTSCSIHTQSIYYGEFKSLLKNWGYVSPNSE